MVNPDAPPPALITTVKPVPINPKEIWEAEKSPDLERNLAEVETSAMEYLTAREEKSRSEKVTKLQWILIPKIRTYSVKSLKK